MGNSANFNHGCQCHSTALLKNEANTCHADARNAPNFQCFARCWVLSRFLHPEKSKGTASPQGQGAKIAGRPSSLQPNAKKGTSAPNPLEKPFCVALTSRPWPPHQLCRDHRALPRGVRPAPGFRLSHKRRGSGHWPLAVSRHHPGPSILPMLSRWLPCQKYAQKVPPASTHTCTPNRTWPCAPETCLVLLVVQGNNPQSCQTPLIVLPLGMPCVATNSDCRCMVCTGSNRDWWGLSLPSRTRKHAL